MEYLRPPTAYMNDAFLPESLGKAKSRSKNVRQIRDLIQMICNHLVVMSQCNDHQVSPGFEFYVTMLTAIFIGPTLNTLY